MVAGLGTGCKIETRPIHFVTSYCLLHSAKPDNPWVPGRNIATGPRLFNLDLAAYKNTHPKGFGGFRCSSAPVLHILNHQLCPAFEQ